MLENRHRTFLALCRYESFTKAAEHLHITQPAVSQHLKYLEEYYDCQLIDTSNRKIKLTQEGKLLKGFTTTVYADAQHFKENLQALKTEEILPFNFGATLTIGEYVMPDILSKLLKKFPEMTFHMTVANTQVLQEQLNNGELDFIIVEGLFDKAKYDTTRFSIENFIPVCAADSHLANREVTFEELLQERLILREVGSGTRDIFEHILKEHNYLLDRFEKIIEIGNKTAIKQMVANDLGITFLFEEAVKKELAAGELVEINLSSFSGKREFNFVTLKNSFFQEHYLEVYELMQKEFRS